MYDPLVREVISVWWSVEDGNLDAVLGPDPVGCVVQALGVFATVYRAVDAEERKLLREEEKARRPDPPPGGRIVR